MAGREDRREKLGLARRVGHFLRREDDVDVLLPQRLEPALQPRREDGVAEKEPRLVDDHERRPPVELRLDPVKEVFERRDDDGRPHAP